MPTPEPYVLPPLGGWTPEELPDVPADDPLAREWATYKREARRLLDGGYGNRYLLIHGDTVVSAWDTQRDALQAGRERFGWDEPFMVKQLHAIERPIRAAGWRYL